MGRRERLFRGGKGRGGEKDERSRGEGREGGREGRRRGEGCQIKVMTNNVGFKL